VAGGKRVAARRGAWICFADECGQTLRPHKATTWAPRGVTPIAAVTAAGSAPVSVAGLVCYRPGERSRLIYRTMLHRGRKGEPKGFRERDFARLLDAAYQRLQTPIMLSWDGLSAHKSARMRTFIAADHGFGSTNCRPTRRN
jgi:hypothetical protein